MDAIKGSHALDIAIANKSADLAEPFNEIAGERFVDVDHASLDQIEAGGCAG